MSFSDFVDDHLGKLIGVLVIAVLGVIGLFAFSVVTVETFGLRKDEWACTDAKTEMVAVVRMQPAGNNIVVPITEYREREACYRYERKAR